jgi:hypothetical protein
MHGYLPASLDSGAARVVIGENDCGFFLDDLAVGAEATWAGNKRRIERS